MATPKAGYYLWSDYHPSLHFRKSQTIGQSDGSRAAFIRSRPRNSEAAKNSIVGGSVLNSMRSRNFLYASDRICRNKSLSDFQRDSTRSMSGSDTSWSSCQLVHPSWASVGPDSDDSALRNSSLLSEEALMPTSAMIMFLLATLMKAFPPKIKQVLFNEHGQDQTRV